MIHSIFISPLHNYFGHHGEPPGEAPMIAVPAIECVAGRGLVGDRFFDYKENYKGQATFFALETYEALCRALTLQDRSPASLRRNIVTFGMNLNGLIGKKFNLQGIEFEGTEECRPCHWMDTALAPGAEQLLRGHGGLRVRILSDGVLRTGD